jgi:ABC-type lipoprotein release transport system permease subunit
MTAVGLLVGSDLRRRWRSLVGVALLVGVIGAIVLGSLAGARRTDSAYTRLREALNTSDVSIEVGPEYFDEISRLPQVAAVAPMSYFFVLADGMGEDLLPIASLDADAARTIDRPLLLEGRFPRDAHEVMLNSDAADRMGAGVGDQVQLASLTPDQLVTLIDGGDPGEPAGPDVRVRVVGVGRTELELAGPSALMMLTPAFYERYESSIGHFDDILGVKLNRGQRDVAAFERGLSRVVPEREGAIVESQVETAVKIEDAIRVQAISLLIFAIAVGITGIVAVGQVLARQVGAATADQPALQALGLARRQRFLALVVPAVVVAGGGAAVAAVLAAVLSPLLPAGFARRVEPAPGFAVDWLVLGLGFVLVAILVAGRAAISAWRTSNRLDDPAYAGAGARMVRSLTRAGLRPPALTGVRMAVEPGRGRTAVRVVPALAGAVLGVAGLIAALTFGAALDWVVTEPVAYGMTWDTSVVSASRDPDDAAREAAEIAKRDDVADATALNVLPLRLAGVPLQSYQLSSSVAGFVSVAEGRAPTGVDEVLVGSETLARLDRRIGDTVRLTGLEGGARRTVRIVGRGVFPEFVNPAVPDSDTGAYNNFAVLTGPGTDVFIREAGGEVFSLTLIRWAPGVDRVAAQRQLEQRGTTVDDRRTPDNFTNLGGVDAFPALIAGFLILVAVVAIGHGLVTSVRRRARDFALLRTLGFVGSQLRATVAWQATTLATIGLVLGIPVGLIVGRAAWSIVADRLGINAHITVPWIPILVTVPAVVIVANALAALPAWRASRTRPATVLRSE